MSKNSKKREAKERKPIEDVPESLDDGDSKFARALGSGDFHTRDQGLQALSRWLQSQPSVDAASLQKLWKGIMFCFWHSDKEPVQQDLAQRLAGVLHQVQDEVCPDEAMVHTALQQSLSVAEASASACYDLCHFTLI
jgi:Nucleolar protein,Nop52